MVSSWRRSMENSRADVSIYLRRTRLPPNALAQVLQCDVTEVDEALAGRPLSDSVRVKFESFRERRDISIAAYAEGWDLLARAGDEIWARFTTMR
jgi:hypothetical protein